LIKKYNSLVDWVWIDTNTKLPINVENIKYLSEMKSCLVCPERWGRPEDIISYRRKMNLLGFKPNAVMTNVKYFKIWEQVI
jgi:hypothetical protein